MTPFPTENYEDNPCELRKKLDRTDLVTRMFFWLSLFVTTVLMVALFFYASKAYAGDIDMLKIADIESSRCQRLVGDAGRSLGCWQVSKEVIHDWNISHAIKFSHDDMLLYDNCFMVADWYYNIRIPAMLLYYNIPDTELHRIASYNWGIGNVVKWYDAGAEYKKLPKNTRKYYEKYSTD